MKKDTTKTLIIIGVLAIGGYLLYRWVTGLGKPITDAIGGAVDTFVSPITPPVELPPTVLTPGGSTITPPSPLNYAFPPSGLPGFWDFTQQGSKWVLGNIADIATTAITGKQPTAKTTYTPPSAINLLKASPIPSVAKMATGISQAMTTVKSNTLPVQNQIASTLLSAPIKVIATGLTALSGTTVKATTPTRITGTTPTAVISQPSYIKATTAFGSGAYNKPGGM